MNYQINKITIIGDGGWGTTLAIHLLRKGYPVVVWGAFDAYIQELKKKRVNSKFLAGIKIPSGVQFTSQLDEAINFGELVVLAVPSQYLAQTLKKIKLTDYKNKFFLSVIKGIDTKTHERMSQLIKSELGPIPLAVLSGPTIALEVAEHIPTTAVIASSNQKLNAALQKIFNSSTFRIYTNTDLIGVEVGGSVKNVVAIACGICDGLGLGTNTKAAIVTRGLAEIARLGKAMGAKSETFYGLTGLGDLVTTCFSPKSRNRSVGEELGRGKSIKNILSSMDMVAEGVVTAKAVYGLSKKLNVKMPITEEVYNILYRNKKPARALSDLMTRSLKAE